MSAASFEVARLLRAAGADGCVELNLGGGPSILVTFRDITPAETITSLSATLGPFSAVVSGLSFTCEPDKATAHIALAARTLPAQLPALTMLADGPDVAVGSASPGVPLPSTQPEYSGDDYAAALSDLPDNELQSALDEVSRCMASLYAQLAERTKQLEAASGERYALDEELRRRAGDRAAANRAIEDFLSTLSHELRTPLNAMLGWARLLRIGQMDRAGADRALDALERNARLQAQLISDILDASRIVTGYLRLDLHPVRIGAVISAAIESVRADADAKQIIVDAAVRFRGRVNGDPDRLEQVVRNLLANAIKFTPAGGRIHVSLARRRRAVALTVTDTGEGIDQAFLPFVFERFRQGDTSVRRSHGGLGLGLSIVRHIIELHGGRVEVASEGRGYGAAFTVYLPVSDLRDAVADSP